MSNNPHIGESLDDFLIEEGIYEQAHEIAVKRVLAWQIEQCMQEQHISKTDLAARMGTSRAAVDRLLDPTNTAITLSTMTRSVAALGKRLELKIT